ncbi:hypothetical protein ACFVTM_17125 [Arthrobacter sp. NPDC058130]|uniref:hypothetical protein n=1 Tax=Arthrobacter sp. NPDC058130 TaxID=3346353 RepID=UPI0036E2AB36
MTEELRLPINPEGTVGVGVIDGAYGEASSTEEIRQEVQSYLSRSGLHTSPMSFKGTGSAAGDFLWAVGTGLATDVLIHIWMRTKAFIATWRGRKEERMLRAHRKDCTFSLETEEEAHAIRLSYFSCCQACTTI